MNHGTRDDLMARRARNILQAAGIPERRSPSDQPWERRRTTATVDDDGTVELRLLGERHQWDGAALPFDDAVESLKRAATVLEVMAS